MTPGIGLLWFAVRREWRSLAIALGATALVVIVSAVFAPDPWVSWVQSLAGTPEAYGINHVPVPLLVRLPLAAALVTWGALTDRPWTVPLLPCSRLSMVAGSLALLLPSRKAWFRPIGSKSSGVGRPAIEGSPA